MLLSSPILAAPSPSGDASDESRAREALTSTLIDKWSPHVEKQYRLEARKWAAEMAPVLAGSSLELLERASAVSDFELMNDLLLGRAPSNDHAASAEARAKVLGDVASDLVFVPITPCRIFDTRLAGGVIPSAGVRSIDVTAVSDYSFQGGAASDCGGAGMAGSFAAAMINLTVVSPTNQGFITAYPFGATMPVAATLVYQTGSLISNTSTVRLDQGASANEMSIYSSAQTHLVGDLIGYYINPQATALQCVDAQSAVVVIGANNIGSAISPLCAAGYTIVSGGCTSSSYDNRMVTSRIQGSTQFCAFRNEGASSVDVTAIARCCRVPGR